jgi:hypothetical protein
MPNQVLRKHQAFLGPWPRQRFSAIQRNSPDRLPRICRAQRIDVVQTVLSGNACLDKMSE